MTGRHDTDIVRWGAGSGRTALARRGHTNAQLTLTQATTSPSLQIIADGGPQIGFGHIGRCLAIAEEFGHDAVFTVDDGSAARFVEAHGGRVLRVAAPVVLLDRRRPTEADEVRAWHDAGQRVVLLDDMGAGRETADLVVDPPTAAHWPSTHSPRLAGFEHVLLRREVLDAAPVQGARTSAPSPRVLLAMGGSDPTAATPVLASALAQAGIDVTAVLGPGYRGSRPSHGSVLEAPGSFVEALAGADLFVASYGHSLLEAAYLGVPAIAVVVLAEHREHAAAFCANGTAELLDMSAELRPEALVELVSDLLGSAERRAALAIRGRELVDGRGRERVATAIRALGGANGQHSGAGLCKPAGIVLLVIGVLVHGRELVGARKRIEVDPSTAQAVDRSRVPVAGDDRSVVRVAVGRAGVLPVRPAELSAMYQDSYYQEHYPGWLAKDRAEQAYWDLEHADKLSDWSELLGSDTATLLDVGCSGGLLLEFARERGWRTIGIEPSSEAVAEARSHGLDVRHGLYEEIEIGNGSIDVVHAKLVVEHLPDPRSFARWAATVLRPGGILCIHVPNDFNPLQLAARDALKKADWWVAPPFHINYFDFAALERLASTSGFQPVRRDATFPVEWFLLMGEDYIGDDELGASVHRRRMALEVHLEALALRRPLHAHLAAHGIGREAIVHARLIT